jgi:general L-amino acid transport system substrate-binding protein
MKSFHFIHRAFPIACTACIVALLAVLWCPQARAGDTLDKIRMRGELSCGVCDNQTGFAAQDAHGRWNGIDADFCRALAATALGDPEKVRFVPLISSARFPALKAGDIDVLVRSTTWTLSREAGLELAFAGTLYYDFQSIMVRTGRSIKSLDDLRGATIGVVKATTHEAVLKELSAEQGLQLQFRVFESFHDAKKAFLSEDCQILTGDGTDLAIMRMHAPGGPDAYTILPGKLHKEPLGPAVRRGDEEWFTLVKWVLFALIEAEEQGITQQNAAAMRDTSKSPYIQELLGKAGNMGSLLGVDRDWVVRIIKAVGNYGEIFDRNLGAKSPLKIDRSYNRLWKDGGLLIAPPFR